MWYLQLYFFVKTVLTIMSLFCLQTNFLIICSSSVKKATGEKKPL